MASHPNTFWKAPSFHFNSPNLSEDWQVFYTWAIDYLKALNINTEMADESHTGWKQLCMMFKGEDRKSLQSLIDNGTITTESQKTPKLVLDAIGTTIKSKEHFWHFWDELLSNICQLPGEGIHTLSTHICTLITIVSLPTPNPWTL